MRPCPRCGRTFAEVRGAAEQACPWCGHVFTLDAPAPGAPAEPVDPVAALALAGRTLRRRYLVLLLAWAPVALLQFLVSYPVERALPADVSGLGVDEQLRLLGLALPALLASGTFALAGWSLVAAAAFGGTRALLRRLGALVALGALLMFTFVAGVLLLVVPFVVFLHWFAYAPAALAEGRTVGQAMEASRRFARERRPYGFTALLLLAYVPYALLAHGLSVLLEVPLGALGVSGPAAVALAAALGAWPLAPLLPLLPASYWRLGTTAAPSPAPGPSEPGARGTTKCPRCGTLLPRGEGEVRCPACGFTGRPL